MGRILVDSDIINLRPHHLVSPFDLDMVNPASLDIRVGRRWVDVRTGKERELPVVLHPASTLTSWTNRFRPHHSTSILVETLETFIFPDNLAGDVKLKTSPARAGLNHTLAGWIDPGYTGRLTLTLHATKTIRLVSGMRIAQIVFHRLDSKPDNPYDGHYQGIYKVAPAWNAETFKE